MSEMASTSEMLIRPADLSEALDTVTREGFDMVLKRLRSREPLLLNYLMKVWDEVYEQLRCQPQTPGYSSALRDYLTEAIVVAMTAQSTAQYRLWRETSVGTRLEQIDPALRVQSESGATPTK